jgi:enoyl-[acyl-carrier protein] reductase II
MEERLSKLWDRGRAFLGVRYPLISGAMTWISDAKLVRTVGEAGAFGVLAAGNMPVENLEAEIRSLQEADPALPFAVNLITIAPNYQAHLRKAAERKVPFIVFAGSFPRKAEVVRAKSSGAKVMCFASTDSIASRMIDYGADALILEGSEAGGHIGHVSTIVLIQEVLFRFGQVPVFVAGGIATGRMIAHLLLMGAAGVQMGTIFAMSEECRAHPAFKERFRRARSREAMATPEYDSSLPVVSVRAIKNQGVAQFGRLQLDLLQKMNKGEIGRLEAQAEVERFWVGALRRAVEEGDVETGSLMAGQCVGLIDEVKPVRTIVRELVREAEETLARLGQA